MKYLALLLLSGCAIFPPDYKWARAGEPSASYEWRTLSRASLIAKCPQLAGMRFDWAGCVPSMEKQKAPNIHCTVYSNVTEEAAKHLYGGDNLSLWEHELKHCAGWVHQGLGGSR